MTRIASPTFAPERRTGPGGRVSPRAVTEMTSGPSQAFVSPPMSATPKRSAIGAIPAKRPKRMSEAFAFGNATATTTARASPAIAAISERFTGECLVADLFGGGLAESEMAAVHEHVGRDEKLRVRS